MKILLDTNIIIHREASKVVNQDIGQLYNWIDKLHYDKFIHPLTISEISKHADKELVKTMMIKLSSYNEIKIPAPINKDVQILLNLDINENDKNDTLLLNEIVNNRTDILISEDNKIHKKAEILNISEKVYRISNFLDEVLSEYPALIDYKVLSVQKKYFGEIDLSDEFFDTFREDYIDFDKWFNSKASDEAYVCIYNNKVRGFLYLKSEYENENYNNINPTFLPKRRLKIGSFKITLYGFKLGERFLKIIFDNALKQNVDEIYATIFDNKTERLSLINLLESFGFYLFGNKSTSSGKEKVYIRDFSKKMENSNPRLTYPYFSLQKKIFFVPIYEEYHTELFPDSILRTESPSAFLDNEPHRNAISKVYISHAYERQIKKGDILLFYRTGGYYKGVVTTIGIVESIKDNIKNEKEYIKYCLGKTVLSNIKLLEFWNRFPDYKPFVINFLYCYSLPKRPNLKSLIDVGVFPDTSLPRGISPISTKNFKKILDISNSNENIIVD